MISEEELLVALDKIIHPSFGVSIVALEMISSVTITAERFEVEMVMNCPVCAAGKVALAHAYRALRGLLVSGQEGVMILLLLEVWTALWKF